MAYLKSLREFIEQHGSQRAAEAAKYQAEIELLQKYLPTQLTDDEIRAEAQLLVDSGNDKRGMVMKALKEKHGAAIDGKRAMAVLEQMGLK